MHITSAERAAYCKGVTQSADLLDKLAQELNVEITSVAEILSDLGRSDFGYSSTKAKLRALENQYRLLTKTSESIRALADNQVVLSSHKPDVEDDFGSAEEVPSASTGSTHIRLKSASGDNVPVAKMLHFPATPERAHGLLNDAIGVRRQAQPEKKISIRVNRPA